MKPRPIRIEGEHAFVTLTQGYETIIDVADAALVAEHNWQAWPQSTGHVYAARTAKLNGRKRTLRLHHVLLPIKDKLEVDHINGNCLDNRRCNLRIVDRSGNKRNGRVHQSGRVPGIYFDKRRGTYRAVMMLGVFSTMQAAEDAIQKAEALLPYLPPQTQKTPLA